MNLYSKYSFNKNGFIILVILVALGSKSDAAFNMTREKCQAFCGACSGLWGKDLKYLTRGYDCRAKCTKINEDKDHLCLRDLNRTILEICGQSKSWQPCSCHTVRDYKPIVGCVEGAVGAVYPTNRPDFPRFQASGVANLNYYAREIHHAFMDGLGVYDLPSTVIFLNATTSTRPRPTPSPPSAIQRSGSSPGRDKFFKLKPEVIYEFQTVFEVSDYVVICYADRLCEIINTDLFPPISPAVEGGAIQYPEPFTGPNSVAEHRAAFVRPLTDSNGNAHFTDTNSPNQSLVTKQRALGDEKVKELSYERLPRYFLENAVASAKEKYNQPGALTVGYNCSKTGSGHRPMVGAISSRNQYVVSNRTGTFYREATSDYRIVTLLVVTFLIVVVLASAFALLLGRALQQNKLRALQQARSTSTRGARMAKCTSESVSRTTAVESRLAATSAITLPRHGNDAGSSLSPSEMGTLIQQVKKIRPLSILKMR